MKTKGRIPDHAKCPTFIGYSECPGTDPYSYKQGLKCCGENIDYNMRNASHPHLNFDSGNFRDDDGTKQGVACDSPQCVNFKCLRYRCFLKNKDLSGGKFHYSFLSFCFFICLFREH